MAKEVESREEPSQEMTTLEWLDSQLAKKPQDAGLWYSKGVLLAKRGELDSAVKSFDNALWLDPNHLKALEAKAKALFRMGRYLEAYDAFKKLTMKEPRDEEYWYYCGESLLNMGSHRKAASYYDKALEINPNYADAWIGRGNALKEASYEEGAPETETPLPAVPLEEEAPDTVSEDSGATDPTVEDLLTEAEAALYEEDYQGALKLYEVALAIDQSESRAWEGKGEVLTRLSRFSEAAECYERAIRTEPGVAHSWIGLGKALREDGQHEEALRSYKEAVRIDPHDIETAVEMREISTAVERREEVKKAQTGLEIDGQMEMKTRAGQPPVQPFEFPAFATYVSQLDTEMGGGVGPGSVILVRGPPGSFKTSLCFWILYQQAVREGTKGLFITLEQPKRSLVRQMTSLGLDLWALTDDLRILDLTEYRLKFRPRESRQQWLPIIKQKVEEVRKEGVKALVLDSLDALESMAAFQNRRREIFRLFDFLRSLEMTAFVIAEQGELEYEGEAVRVYDVADFLSDGIIELSTRERHSGDLQRALRIAKMRDREHATSLYYLYYTDEACIVDAPYT